MDHGAVYQLLAKYLPNDLPLFADYWSRWPQEPNAEILARDLEDEARFWEERRPDVGSAMMAAAKTIRERAQS